MKKIMIMILCLMMVTSGYSKGKKKNINDKTKSQRKTHCPKPKFVKTNNAWQF